MKFIWNGQLVHVLFYGDLSGVVYNPSTGECQTLSTHDIVNSAFEHEHGMDRY